MDEREILIADKDTEMCREVANYFREAGYQVETTDSTVHVLCSILEKQTPVLLLTDDLDRKIAPLDLVHLLKKCNRRLAIILVSDEVPLPLERRLREEGIFYHALKPATAKDTEEIRLAVECAFEKPRKNH
jgi:DNA-binding NtrC family response regulator